MRSVGRLLRILLVVVVIAVAALSGVVGAVTIRALPQQDGAIQVPGLGSSATVLRDAAGIVNIYADNPGDLFTAQGYVHAQERLWQMEVWRHISSGRLSELFGKTTLDQDRFIRTLGWRKAAEQDFAQLGAGPRAALDAYAQGVNAFITGHQGSFGLAFVVTGMRSGLGGIGGYEVEPWTPIDSLAWQKVQAWQLGGNFDTEVFRMLADEQLGDPALTDQLYPPYAHSMPVIAPSGATASVTPNQALAPAYGSAGRATDAEAAAWRDVAALGDGILNLAGLDGGAGLAGDHQVGSNNWVVSAELSQTGSPLLANDPHLGISMPSVWFMNGLHCRTVSADCPYDVTGVTFPGIPGVVLGHNARIAWGATNTDPDVQDLFVESPDPDEPDNYLFAGESIPFATRTETIEVANGADVEMAVRETRHGPILNDVDPRLIDAPLLALRWTATAEVDHTFEAFYHLMTAANFDDFKAAFAGYGAPSQNFVYADVDGHIGYVLPGKIPIRDGGDRGDRPRSGSDGAHEWSGYIPTDELPTLFDPPNGVIVTANNAAVDAGYPYFVAAEWDPGYRAARIAELIDDAAGGGGLTVEEMAAIQTDTKITRADRVKPHLDGIDPATPDGDAVLEAIAAWDGMSDPASVGASAYCAFEYRLLRGLFDDELGDLAREYVGGGASWSAMIGLLDEPGSPWWDDTTSTGRKESAPDIITQALDAAGADLRGGYGEPKDWTWGRVHEATFREPTLGTSGIGPLEWYFNKGPVQVGGAAGAVLNTYYRPDRTYPDPYDPSFEPVGFKDLFEVTNLPSYRLLVDLGDLDGARIVQTTGQSGVPFDGHYGDLIDDWATGQMVPLFFTEQAVEATLVKRLTLVP
ncbi:MAG TPA: penicillin acylase family protein [Candidatus Limnocylindrales bacterium]|nr:penicillin acylase family protein [Candidatus Limnocylindrales bacterium]